MKVFNAVRDIVSEGCKPTHAGYVKGLMLPGQLQDRGREEEHHIPKPFLGRVAS
jgi:hypothetical protein